MPVTRRGYGAAVRGGFAEARGDLLVMADADATYCLDELPRFIEAARGADFVMGTRFPGAGGIIHPGAMPPLHRWLGTPVLTALARLLFGTTASDVNCGFRAIRRDALARMQLRMIGMELASEMVLKAALLRLRTNEVPVTLRRSPRTRVAHLRTWRDGWRHLRMMLLYSPKWLFGLPGVVLAAAGGVTLLALARGPLQIGPTTFDTNTMLVGAMAFLTGVQVTLLGLLAHTFVAEENLLPAPTQRTPSPFEYGIAVGAIALIIGIGLVGWAFAQWQQLGFGGLAGTGATRLVILGTTLVMLGVEFVSTAFLFGVLRLPRLGER